MCSLVHPATDPALRTPGLQDWVWRAADRGWLRPTAEAGWCIQERRYSHGREPAVEARFTVANGLLGIRGGLEEDAAPPHPRMFVAGLFDERDADPPIPALVPAPDWLGLRVSLDGAVLRLGSKGVTGHVRTLDMRQGALWREWHYRDEAGRLLRVRTLRFASAVRRSVAVHVMEISADHSRLVSVEQLPVLSVSELNRIAASGPLTIWETRHRRRPLALARVALLDGGEDEPPLTVDPDRREPLLVKVEPEKPATLTRIVVMVPAAAGDDPGREALAMLARARDLGARRLFAEHTREWERRWAASDVQVEADQAAQRSLRFGIYHLISAANPDDDRVSVGARGLTGEAYWGHVFWDTDIFLSPFYSLTWPEAARAMLMYRYRGLPAARAKAVRLGFRGALYAWEAAEAGEEATPDFVYGLDGERIEIKTGTEEHHISADVAFAVWHYWHTTGDDAFLRAAGAEIILETARFWASRVVPGEDGRLHIRRVIGPDEYHEDVDDNAYTNLLARWNLRAARDVARLMRRRWPERWAELRRDVGITPAELRSWERVAADLAVSVDPATHVLEQFAGYFNLDPINLADYEPRTQPMDVLLGREATQRSQVIKQADVLMLLVLLWERFRARERRANFRYYEPRSGHGSSLSPAIHALLSARLGELALAERYFRQAAAIDLDDTMGNAAAGVHMATQGGLWQAAIFGFAGLRVCPDGLSVDPHLPTDWRVLAFRAQWRGRCVHVSVRPAEVTATLEAGAPLTIHVGRTTRQLEPGRPLTLPWGRRGRIRKELTHE